MIQNFKDKRTEKVAANETPKGFPTDLVKRSRIMIAVLDAAVELKDLRSPPGNRLEKLSGNRKHQHSVRVNDQWRVCFEWTDTGPSDVEIVDYHKG